MSNLALFQEKQIRRHWDEKQEKRYFSVVDIVGVLSESKDPRNYWKVLKNRLTKEWSETVTNCNQLKMLAPDGKMRLTDVADVNTILRLVQSIPSPNAEPFKIWLAKVGYERMQETVDPALSLERARENRKKHGRSEKWIQQRMMGQETRNKLTDYRHEHRIKKWDEYAILTNIIHQERMGGHPWALAKDINEMSFLSVSEEYRYLYPSFRFTPLKDDRMISDQNFLPLKKK